MLYHNCYQQQLGTTKAEKRTKRRKKRKRKKRKKKDKQKKKKKKDLLYKDVTFRHFRLFIIFLGSLLCCSVLFSISQNCVLLRFSKHFCLMLFLRSLSTPLFFLAVFLSLVLSMIAFCYEDFFWGLCCGIVPPSCLSLVTVFFLPLLQSSFA